MFRSIDKWLMGYLKSLVRRPGNVHGPKHLMFCVTDHFEPFRDNVPKQTAMKSVDRWYAEFPSVAEGFRDADSKNPCHSFFYPQEEYDTDCVEGIAHLCASGFGEIEIHLHHRNDTREQLRSKLSGFRDILREKHGLLGSDKEGNIRYGFIHGNWALCNSRPDGDWCGVNEELGILRQTGCYADFTFPSAPSPTQPRMVNAIYYASDTGYSRACDTGRRVSSVQHSVSGVSNKSLMLITGPLALNWHRRKWGLLPRLENGAITFLNPPIPERIDLWTKQHIHVEGRPDWIFVKVYTHGCQQGNMDVLLGKPMREAYEHLQTEYNDGKKWNLHFVTAREMYNVIRAAEDGKTDNPGNYRDYEISKPPVC
ncbi:MAG: hypothetical protein PHR77_01655 [Kiritimatiellae bacterium]|nr:hypothetical protein [Kiritimatiellia bacterium]MDD5521912.1 hypothetical protein [Kiritimatiellia bacterium]